MEHPLQQIEAAADLEVITCSAYPADALYEAWKKRGLGRRRISRPRIRLTAPGSGVDGYGMDHMGKIVREEYRG